jgi:hypothetical protein
MSLTYPLDDEIFIFSSHAWAYLHRRDGLTNLITTDWVKGVDFFDLSVTSRHPIDSEDDPDLARELRDRVRISDALLVTAGMFVINRPWIKFEIDMALAFDRPIIPVIFNGQERVPKVARQFAWCDPVKWRGDSIRDAILQFLPPHRRCAFEAKLARRAAAAQQRRAAIAAMAYATQQRSRPPVTQPVFLPQKPPTTIIGADYRRDPGLSPSLPPALLPRRPWLIPK